MTESAFENLLRSIHLPFGELLPDGKSYIFSDTII